jgi:hypothetical protein
VPAAGQLDDLFGQVDTVGGTKPKMVAVVVLRYFVR